jgi:structural maintenance of chromosome 1
LKEKRNQLQEEQNQLHKNRPRELDVEMKRTQLKTLDQRLQQIRNEIRRTEENTITRLETELDTLRGEHDRIEPRIQNKTEEMESRQQQITKLEEEKNQIADTVFKDFCKRVGIRHIREYEQREVRFHEEMEREKNKHNQEIERLREELDYLKSEDKKVDVKREKDKIEKLKKEQTALEVKLEEQQQKLQTLEESLKELQEEVKAKKAEVEKAEAAVALVKKESQGVDREVHSLEKKILQLEQVENRKAQERHSLLHECKMNGIDLPLNSGSLNAIVLNDDLSALAESQSQHASSSAPNTSSQSQSQYEGAESIEVDYTSLKHPQKKLQDESEVNKMVEKVQKSVQETEAMLAKMSAPNLKADERMEAVKEKEQETSNECEAMRKKAKKIRNNFEKVKNERIQRFNDFFEPVAQKIDEIYKQLSQNHSAQAMLSADNPEEPYADGISYNCVAPGKRFRPMDNLSGGEKTIAALALLFAIHASMPSPFFVLDEIDAALDNTNIGKVVSYVTQRAKTDIQLIVISLKEELFNKAHGLVGIFPKHGDTCMSSGFLTYDLEHFDA